MAQVPKSQLTPIQMSVINQSTVVTDDQVIPVVGALQKQVTNDFRPIWGIDAELQFVPSGAQPPPGTWWLSILDDSDQANALGYHDLTTDGLPIGKVFAGTDLRSALPGRSPPATNCWKCWPIPTSTSLYLCRTPKPRENSMPMRRAMPVRPRTL